jgi:diadenosine tetraphosphate (Ap4A) HIT family hydrolase
MTVGTTLAAARNFMLERRTQRAENHVAVEWECVPIFYGRHSQAGGRASVELLRSFRHRRHASFGRVVKWPQSFYDVRQGHGCVMCEQGRPEETSYGVRFFAGAVSDAYLQRANIQRGYTIVVWRGRHVAEPTGLSAVEASAYWLEVIGVARALEAHLHPVKTNYNVLGNSLPHLHTHVIPRYADDPRPGWPFPFPEGEAEPIDEELLRADVESLRALCRI